MTLVDAVILGIVEGLTEYLPVSSTGHLIIVSALLGLDAPTETKEAVDAFNIVIQGGAILAVIGLYRRQVAKMVLGVLGKDREGLKAAINVIIAFLPAAVAGLALHDTIEEKLFAPWPVIAALVVGGVWMMGVDWWWRKKKGERGVRAGKPPAALGGDSEQGAGVAAELSVWQALAIGVFQCVALWPGTSRSMMTIVGGVMLGLKPAAAAEFSFLLGLPTLGAACVYSGLKNREALAGLGVGPVVTGVVVATVSAALAVKWMTGFLNRHGLMVFGIYRIGLSGALGLMVWWGVVKFG